jgi:hypothetical protein
MAEPTLEERLAQYGTSLDEARRKGVVREGSSWARRLVPAAAFVTAFAAVVAAVVLIPRDDNESDRLRPADIAAAEAEIRDAFATWLDETATDEARREVREQLDDSAVQARAEANWENAEVSYLRSEVIVDNVEFAEGDRAFVDFRLRFPDSPGGPVMVEPVPGEAVHRDGAWRVGYASICALRMGEMACNPDDFLTEEQQAIGQPFVNIAWSELPDDQRVREIEGGGEIRDQILDGVNGHRNMLGGKTQLLAVRHRPGEKTAKVWWTVGTVQPGIAVLDGDHWTVSRETWCGLTRNAGEYPPACGESAPTTSTIATTTTTVPAIEPFTYEVDGPLVRGAIVRLTVRGLDRLRGQRVSFAFWERLPDGGLPDSRNPGGYMPGGVVDDAGTLVTNTGAPNLLATLDGSHSYPAIVVGKTYEFFVLTDEVSTTLWYRSTIRIDAAPVGTAYTVTVYHPGSDATCGAPPVYVYFDGRDWVPNDGSTLASEPDRFTGKFTLLSETSARFTFDDGRTVPFSLGSVGFC